MISTPFQIVILPENDVAIWNEQQLYFTVTSGHNCMVLAHGEAGCPSIQARDCLFDRLQLVRQARDCVLDRLQLLRQTRYFVL